MPMCQNASGAQNLAIQILREDTMIIVANHVRVHVQVLNNPPHSHPCARAVAKTHVILILGVDTLTFAANHALNHQFQATRLLQFLFARGATVPHAMPILKVDIMIFAAEHVLDNRLVDPRIMMIHIFHLLS